MEQPYANVQCPQCGTMIRFDIPDEVVEEIQEDAVAELRETTIEVPKVRGKIRPDGVIFTYPITSDQLKEHLTELLHEYLPGAMLEVVPMYIEKKAGKNKDRRARSFSALQVAFSEEVINHAAGNSFYGKVGDLDGTNVRFVRAIWKNMIEKFMFNRDMINGWIKNYRKLDELEERHGITEKFLEELSIYVTPKRATVAGMTDSWVIVALRVDKIIEHILVEQFQKDDITFRIFPF